MILQNQLYTISDHKTEDGKDIFTVALNPECFIYKAHFPGNPITPGVCIVQTCAELLGEITGKKMEIIAAKDIKFLNVLSPLTTATVDFVFSAVASDGDNTTAKISVTDGNEVFDTVTFTCSAH